MDEAALSLLAATGFMLALPEAAHADILTGRIASLAHPVAMIALFGSSVYTAVLGFQYRRTRDLAAEIKDLKAQAPTAPKGEGEEASSAVASPEQSRIKELEQERKDLIRKKLNEKHYTWGSVLLGLGITFSIIGPVNTYLRTGKLFPGPHLYFGALITVLWALAASLSPAMQKGNETARITHITLNCLALFFFASQGSAEKTVEPLIRLREFFKRQGATLEEGWSIEIKHRSGGSTAGTTDTIARDYGLVVEPPARKQTSLSSFFEAHKPVSRPEAVSGSAACLASLTLPLTLANGTTITSCAGIG
ncbi:hypothetical protein F751_4760 [Auxenochlorella protothecoides]|nr:hypothetical protein F751_4760 [Auxenochlorella protothecoides]KFM26267.1 hypothetical protein F751_4760 [Auxenochlorella protothecoides]